MAGDIDECKEPVGRRRTRRKPQGMNQTKIRKLDRLGVNCMGDDTDGGSAIACDSQLQ